MQYLVHVGDFHPLRRQVNESFNERDGRVSRNGTFLVSFRRENQFAGQPGQVRVSAVARQRHRSGGHIVLLH